MCIRDSTHEKLSDAINLDVRSTIQKHLRTQHKKWYIALKVIFSKAVDPSITTIPSIVFTSHPVHTASATSLDTALANAKQELIDKIDQFVAGGSGWVIDSLEEIDLVLSTYDPLRGSSYIELPKKFRNASKGLLNIRNNDQKCFFVLRTRASISDHRKTSRDSFQIQGHCTRVRPDRLFLAYEDRQHREF